MTPSKAAAAADALPRLHALAQNHPNRPMLGTVFPYVQSVPEGSPVEPQVEGRIPRQGDLTGKSTLGKGTTTILQLPIRGKAEAGLRN
jgi:hypothetical protein